MRGTNLRLFALRVLLSTTILVPLLLTGIASARSQAPLSQYGRCTYQGDLLVCGPCALHDATSAVGARERCGAAYRCKSNNCAVLSRCAEQYTCDLCGCSWGPQTGLSHHQSRFAP